MNRDMKTSPRHLAPIVLFQRPDKANLSEAWHDGGISYTFEKTAMALGLSGSRAARCDLVLELQAALDQGSSENDQE
jgi:hypothetical protein